MLPAWGSMLALLQVIGVILAAVALVPALAHALEMPGKMRLARESYFAAQTIYYPGFTIAGSADFWLSAAALCGFAGMQAVYWIRTHPVNKVWLHGEKLGAAGSGFFSLGPGVSADWKQLRERWERSHAARAVLAALSFIALAVSGSSQ